MCWAYVSGVTSSFPFIGRDRLYDLTSVHQSFNPVLVYRMGQLGDTRVALSEAGVVPDNPKLLLDAIK